MGANLAKKNGYFLLQISSDMRQAQKQKTGRELRERPCRGATKTILLFA